MSYRGLFGRGVNNMRLINADAITETRELNDKIMVVDMTPYISLEDLIDFIDRLPTVYDVDNKNYDKAIDDFVSTLIPRLTDAIYEKDVASMTNLINDIAEELKRGVNNDD
jgi:hypothetical protein